MIAAQGTTDLVDSYFTYAHVPQMPVADFALLPVVILSVIAVALAGGGSIAYRRRDAI